MNYYQDTTVSIKHENDTTKLVFKGGDEIGLVFIEKVAGNKVFIPRNYNKGDGPQFLTLTEAVNWVCYN